MLIKSDFSEAYKMFDSIQKREFPFAASVAMNTTMEQIAGKRGKQGFLAKTMDRYIDKGANPYTKGGFFVYRTNKRRLSGYIGIKDKNHYLDTIIFGGQVKPLKDNSKLIQPVNQRLNKYGNIPRNKIKSLLSNPDKYFRNKGRKLKGKYGPRPDGIYMKPANPKRAPKLLIKYEASRRDQRGFYPAPRDAARFYKRYILKNFDIAFKNAVMTSRYRVPTGF